MAATKGGMGLLVVIVAVFLLAPQAGAQVIKVIDGDTVKLQNGENARLKHIDTPELKGKCEAEKMLALAAKERLEQLLAAAEQIDIAFHGRGYYRRPLITLTADGQDVGQTLLAEGLARPYKRGRRGWCE